MTQSFLSKKEVSFWTDIMSFAQGTRHKKVFIKMPEGCISRGAIARRLKKHIFQRRASLVDAGLITGNWGYHDDVLYFIGATDHFDSVLFYADAPMESFAGIAGLSSFRIEDGVWGTIVPVWYIYEHLRFHSFQELYSQF